MLPDRILAELRRRPILRRALSLAGYVGGAVAVIAGGVAFSTTADMDAQMAAGWPLVIGLGVMVATYEARKAIRALPARKPNPIESDRP